MIKTADRLAFALFTVLVFLFGVLAAKTAANYYISSGRTTDTFCNESTEIRVKGDDEKVLIHTDLKLRPPFERVHNVKCTKKHYKYE